jgi:Domain of unknown function (DUF4905)
MDLLKRFGKNQLRPLWRYTATGVLWQIVTDSPLYIVGEDRDLNAREVSYFCLDRRTGIPLWKDVRLEEGWWSGIEAVNDSWVIFHGFASPDLPVHRGVTVVATPSGSILWKNPDVKYLSLGGSILSVKGSTRGGETLLLDVETGADAGEDISAHLPATAPRGRAAGENGIRIPAEIMPQSGEFERYAMLGLLHRGVEDLLAPPECLEQDGLALFALHSRGPEGSGVVSRFSLFRISDGALLFEETLGESRDVPAGRSFFVQNDVVYFVQRRSTLLAVPLKHASGS